MKILFKNTTKYNSKNYNQFVEFHNNKYNTYYKLYTLIYVLIFLYCFIINAKQKNVLFSLLFILIILAFLIYRIFVPAYKYKKSSNKLKNNKQLICVFCFGEHYFTMNGQKVYYIRLHKVIETSDYFYLYVDKENAALVNKKGFSKGEPSEFSDFIKKKSLFKFEKD